MVQFKRIIHDYNYWNPPDSFRYCKKMNLKKYRFSKIPKGINFLYKKKKKKQKIQSLQIIDKKKKYICDYTIGKYKKKMCYPQKNNSWL